MNVAFFGTSERSLALIEALNANFELVLCVTKADVKVGRHQDLHQSQVKKWALSHNVPIVELQNIKDQQNELISALNENKVDLGVVADFSFMIPDSIIKTPKYMLINIHFSLLPLYRGASPVQFAIADQAPQIGVTFYVMDKGMDTGMILTQLAFELSGHETAGQVYESLFEVSAEHLPGVINDYVSGKILPQEQDDTLATYTYSQSHPKHTFIYKEDALINWSEPIDKIEAKIRAFNPWPIAYTTVKMLENNAKLDFLTYSGSIRSSLNRDYKLKVYSAQLNNDKILPTEVQLEGKNKQSWQDFLNGYSA